MCCLNAFLLLVSIVSLTLLLAAAQNLSFTAPPELSALDDRLNGSYSSLLSRLSKGDSERVKSAQRIWLADRNSCGCDASCISRHYAQRSGELDAAQFSRGRLTIGYDQEGKIDASPQSCVAYVREMTAWPEADIQKAGREVCAARKRHVDAYEALQAAYSRFARTVSEDRRLNLDLSVEHFRTLMKSCMDHKFQLTTGGHNVRIDIIPNEIAASCLAMGTRMLDYETGRIHMPW